MPVRTRHTLLILATCVGLAASSFALLRLHCPRFNRGLLQLGQRVACRSSRRPAMAVQQYEVTSPAFDQRHYRRLALQNGLHVLLISDPEIHLSPDDTDSAEASDAASSVSLGSNSEETESSRDADADSQEGRPTQSPGYVKQAAAALAVGVGSLSDPDHLPGLSHYLEHMLFMGSQKFPDENEYDAYLTNNGGSANAYTELEHTNYYFDVRPEALHGALDRFSQFFVAPLCKADALEREVRAVDNEFTGVMQRDAERLAQMRCHTSAAGHPYQKFAWGNRKSLWEDPHAAGIDVRKDLVAYYRQHYTARRMSLAVLGGQSLDELQQWVQELFGILASGPGPSPSFAHAGLPFQDGGMHILPAVKTGHSITATFQLPSLHAQYRRKPHDYLSHLVGHEGSGSLLSGLKARGWASGLTAGVGESGFDRSSATYLFEVGITLTEAGLAAGPGMGLAVIHLLFQYLAMLRHQGLQQWVYDEIAQVASTKFTYANEEDASDYVSALAADMQLYAPEDTLNGDSIYEGWDEQQVRSILDYISPSNLRLDLQTSSFDAHKDQLGASSPAVEPWFKLPYILQPIPAAQLQDWQRLSHSAEPSAWQGFAMPPQNAYIPTDFQLVDEQHAQHSAAEAPKLANGAGVKRSRDGQDLPSKEGSPAANGTHTSAPAAPAARPPACIHDSPGLRVWHRALGPVRLPKAAAYFSLAGRHLYDSPEAAAAAVLLIKLVKDALNEQAYLADIAGLQYGASQDGPAIEIQVDGFSHKLPVLTQAVFSELAGFQVSEERFWPVHEAMVRQLKNANLQPERQATYLRLQAIKHFWDNDSVLAALLALTPASLQALIPRLLSDVHIDALLLGNIRAQDALQLAQQVQQQLHARLSADHRHSPQVKQLPDGCLLLYRARTKNPAEENSVVELYYQLGQDSIAERAKADMLEQVTNEPFYNVLRTNEQLGYSVHCGLRLTHSALGFAFVVVSGVRGPAHLQERIEAFVQSFEGTLQSMPEDEWEQHRGALIQGKMQKDASISDEAERFWEQVASRRYNMLEREQEVEVLQCLSHAELLSWFRQHFLQSAIVQRKLAVHIVSQSHTAELELQPAAAKLVSDLEVLNETLKPLQFQDGLTSTETQLV